jgi:hypothetical protein
MYSEWANKIDHFSSQIMRGKEEPGGYKIFYDIFTKIFYDIFTKTPYSFNLHQGAENFLKS